MAAAGATGPVARLVQPTATHTSCTGRSVVRSSAMARSTRRRCRYRCGVSPKVAAKVRMRWPGEQQATAARASMSSGSA